ncbi:MAG: LamG-like jellyroll fold domain-containing protein [Bacteroidales bacterium]
MKFKKSIYGTIVFLPFVISAMPGYKRDAISEKLQRKLKQVPDSLFTDVKQEDLLKDEVYIKLARDGWNAEEIKKIMGDYIRKNRKQVRGSLEYGNYAKQWLPTYGFTPGGDSIYQFIDTTYQAETTRRVRELTGEAFDSYYLSEPYTPDNRKRGQRQPGIFRPVEHKPSSGRIHWIHVHPENDDSLMVIPDGAGIFKTHNAGRSWECITDRIPAREHRNTATHSAIPVDPDDWNHIFAFMSNGNPVYETRDGGLNWRRIEGATHKGFKRGYCFRDSAGSLKFIGAVQNGGNSYWNSSLWVSEDTCKTWTQVIVPDSLKDIHPANNSKGAWFQQVEFDPTNRDLIYLPTSRSIFYFDDGAKIHTDENGRKSLRLKKMALRVFDQNNTVLRSDTTVFPFPGSSQGFLNVNPNNPSQMWFAAGQRNPLHTALYYSSDKGKNWITLQETASQIGSGKLFGNEAPWGWLGGFGVNYRDPNWIYGCSMSSAISSDGGRTFKEYAWGHRLKSLQDDGLYYSVTNSRHNADNHCIVSHKSGRVFRGSDGGMLMKDLDVNNNEWTNIGSNMGQMLYYRVNVNEFGDQLIFGNTQDIDAQTYRYGRWGHWRGYEGSTSFVNPYSNTCYFSGNGGGGIEGAALGSWIPGYGKADVCTGSWFLRRTDTGATSTFFRLDDVGRSMTNISERLNKGIESFALARDKGHSTLFVLTKDRDILKSTDSGETFTTVSRQPGVSFIAADPDNSDILYLGSKGNIRKYDISANSLTPVGEGLPNIDCHRLYFHEGSGDLYFINFNNGLFIKEKDSPRWRLWMKGYNPLKFGSIDINYTTQEMVIADYGRGVYVADLQNPADRYFKNGFALKELSHIEGRRTIGIDTYWTIPLYYYYEWSVNGVVQNNPYQYLTTTLQPGDRIKLKLTLRESPDVSTYSEEYIVKATPVETIQRKSGTALYSNGAGMVDLGYTDYFFNDFTIDLWIKPESNGVILCNRQKDWEKGAKGWHLSLDNGTLRFKYSPANMLDKPTYETAITQQTELNAGKLETGKWSHIAVTQERNGKLRIFINGLQCAEGARIRPEHTLNNAMNMMLFADGYERVAIKATADELKIWNYALSAPEIRRIMHSHESDHKSGLIYYNGFNDAILGANKELFSKTAPRIRKRAETESRIMPVPVNAPYAVSARLDGTTLFASGTTNLMRIHPHDLGYKPELTVYGYESAALTENASNLDPTYYNLASTGFMVKNFDQAHAANDTIDMEVYAGGIRSAQSYRLYISDTYSDKKYWQEYKSLTFNAATGCFRATDISLGDLKNKILLVVGLKPAIETSIHQLNKNGELNVYSSANLKFAIDARLIGDLQEPFEGYGLRSDHAVIQPVGKLHFTKGKASGELTVNHSALKDFGQPVQTWLRGEDLQMIPFPIDVINKISPAEAGSAVEITKGGLIIGEAANYTDIHLSNTVSFMGWVRIDSTTALSGVRPILMFRGGSPQVATGIHLDNGNVRCHWNEEGWSWGTATNLRVTNADLGRWIHLALVVRPNGLDYYLNGAKYSVTRNVNKGRIQSALMLGQNFRGDTWFSGAFDHVAVWNRSLTQKEVLKFMHKHVELNDSALVAYVNMDYLSDKGVVRELVSGASCTPVGTVRTNHRSPVPFQTGTLANAASGSFGLNIEFPEGKDTEYFAQQFKGYPYNYVNAARTAERPLKKAFYTLTPGSATQFAIQDSVRVTIKDEAILSDDQLTLGIRPLGSEKVFEQYIPATITANGETTFGLAANTLNTAAEMMLFIAPESNKRPVKGYLSLLSDSNNANQVILSESDSSVIISVEMSSYNPDDIVLLSVKENAYASVSRDTINTVSENRLAIQINKEKLNKMGWNPVTVSLTGAEADILSLQVALEPKVRLRLKNGNDPHHYTATSPVSTLEVEAELTEGVMEGEVKLTTTSDVNSSMDTGNGTLLTDRIVTLDALEHHTSPVGKQHEGWNLVGNPYLANINLTKQQNVQFDPEKVTKFLYQYNMATENYETSDMTQYDHLQHIIPLQSYFVQTLDKGASLRITPVAKETSINRRTFDYYTATERMFIRLQLYTNGVLSDRTDVILQPDAKTEFVINEDAPKIWSMSTTANQLYTLAGTNAASINTLPVADYEIPLNLKIGKAGKLGFRPAHLSGFAPDEIALIDNTTGISYPVNSGSEYLFDISETGNQKDRFFLKIKRNTTGINNLRIYPVTVEEGVCTIHNLQGNAAIGIFDAQGRMFINTTAYNDTYSVPLQPGTYLVKITENGKEFITKIIVR